MESPLILGGFIFTQVIAGPFKIYSLAGLRWYKVVKWTKSRQSATNLWRSGDPSSICWPFWESCATPEKIGIWRGFFLREKASLVRNMLGLGSVCLYSICILYCMYLSMTTFTKQSNLQITKENITSSWRIYIYIYHQTRIFRGCCRSPRFSPGMRCSNSRWALHFHCLCKNPCCSNGMWVSHYWPVSLCVSCLGSIPNCLMKLGWCLARDCRPTLTAAIGFCRELAVFNEPILDSRW